MIKKLKNKIFIKYKKDNVICYVFIILISILVAIPLFCNGFFITHDGTAHFSRNFATIQGIKNGQFISTIVPNFCGGFGYSWNLFYPPLSTYVNSIFYFIVSNYIISMKLTILLAIICSGIFMFKFMHYVKINKNTSLMVSILYITAIYFIVNIYIRLAIGEIMTYVFLPLFFWGLYSIFYEKGKKNYLLTIGAVGILLSHNISSLIMALLTFIIIIFNWKKLWKNENSFQIWKNLFVNAFFIILIVSFFIVPLLEHTFATDYVAMIKDQMTSKELVLNSTLNLGQVITILGLVILLPLLLTPICYKKIDKDKRYLYIGILILGIITAFMSTIFFPWNIMPYIFLYIQFPWRMLLFSSFFLSIIAGINISICITKKQLKRFFIVILIIIMYVMSFMFRIINFDFNFDISYLYETEKIEDIYIYSQQCAYYEYMPVKAKTPYIQNREDKVIVISGNANIINENKSGTNMQFDIENNLEISTLELPYLYYLGYNIQLNGKEISYKESEHGFISITIPKREKGTVQVKYTGTKLSHISIILSIIGTFGFILYIKRTQNKNKLL